MTLSPTNHWLRRAAALLGLWIAALSLLPMAFADAALDKLIGNMQDRQLLISESYTQLDFRVNNMDPNDPRKEDIKKKLTDAQKAKDAFVNLVPKDNVNGDEPNATFTENEGKAIEAINGVNRFLLAPVQPGASKVGEAGSVPKGNLTQDFLPQVIRLLFRFTSLLILVSLVASGVMFVVAFDNEEFVTKAKHMLYYSLIGFAFVTLAYAIVKGITEVNYFGVI